MASTKHDPTESIETDILSIKDRRQDGGRAGFEKREKRRTIRQLQSAINQLDTPAVEEILRADFDVDFQYGGQTSLQLAVCQGGLDICRMLIDRGANVNQCDANGNSLLNMACWREFRDIAELLVHSGADVDSQNEAGNTSLNVCAYKGFDTIAQILLDAKCDTNLANKKGLTPLHALCQSDNAQMVRQLLRGGADPDWSDYNHQTPLMLAAHLGSVDVVEALLQGGASVNLQSRQGCTATFEAASAGHVKIVRLLMSHSADPNLGTIKAVTPLLEAVGHEEITCAHSLIEAGCDINLSDKTHQAPIHVLVHQMTSMFLGTDSTEKMELLKALVEAGVDVNKKDGTGSTALYQALMGGDTDLCQYLLSKDADMLVVTDSGSTMLHAAVHSGKAELLQLCLDHGCTVNAVNDLGQHALLLAVCSRTDLKVIEMLLDADSDVDVAVKNSQQTALHEAVCQHYEPAAKLLIQRGSDLCAKNREKKTVLYLACQRGLVDTTRAMLSHPGCPTSSSFPWALPVHAAAANGRTPCIEALAEFGCDINQMNEKGETPIMAALQEDSFSAARALLQCGCDLEYQRKLRGLQMCCLHQEDPHPHLALEPLFLALQHKNMDTLKMLLACYRYIPRKILHLLAVLLRTTQGLSTHFSLKEKQEVSSIFVQSLRTPFSLADACRRCVRSCLGSPAQARVEGLPVGEKMKRYILMEDEFDAWKEKEQEMPGGSGGFSDVFVHRHRW